MPRIIPDHVKIILATAGIVKPETSRWRRRRPITEAINWPASVECRCTHTDILVWLKAVTINERLIGIGQCFGCGAIHWAEWQPRYKTSGSEWQRPTG